MGAEREGQGRAMTRSEASRARAALLDRQRAVWRATTDRAYAIATLIRGARGLLQWHEVTT
jgi:hypothetical protein